MIRKLIELSARNRFIVLVAYAVLIVAGAICAFAGAVAPRAAPTAAMLRISCFMPRPLAELCGKNGSLELLRDERVSWT